MFRSFLLASAFAACAAAPALAAPAPTQTWTGFYAGVNGGLGGDKFTYPARATVTDTVPDVDTDPTSVSGSASQNSSGAIGGVQVGYNYQLESGWVLGAEADIDATGIQGRADISGASAGALSGSASAHIQSKIDYLGTVRLRAGMPVADGRFVPFVSGGLAYGQVTSSVGINVTPTSGTPTVASASKSVTNTGWTAGVGADYAITDRLSFRAEYLYVDLGTRNVLNQSFSGNLGNLVSLGDNDETLSARIGVKTTANIVRVALNYKFGG